MNFSAVEKKLKERGFAVSCFPTAAEAAAYLNSQIDQTTVGIGGSITIDQLGVYEPLQSHNTVYWHQHLPEGMTAPEARAAANAASVYLSSVNGLAETGEIINIDGTCNRVSATLYGHEKVYLVAGRNKLAKDYDSALYRARNVAAPLNAKRLGVKTPCAAKGDKCYDCSSPDRICRALVVLWEAPKNGSYEVVLVDEDLGY